MKKKNMRAGGGREEGKNEAMRERNARDRRWRGGEREERRRGWRRGGGGGGRERVRGHKNTRGRRLEKLERR